MRIHPAFYITAVAGLWLSTLVAHAADSPARRDSLAIPVNVTGRPAGGVVCTVTFGPKIPISALAFSPNGKTLAVGGYREVLLWDLAGGKLSKRIAAGGDVGAVAFLKDGAGLAVGEGMPGRSGAVWIVDLQTGQEIFRAKEPQDVVWSLALSPDGKLLAASGAYQPVYVWNLDEQKLVATIQGHTAWVWDVAFSRDGKRLATSGDDSTARIWEVGNGQPVASFAEPAAVHAALFCPDGIQVLLAVGGANGRSLQLRKTDTPLFRKAIGTGLGMPLHLAGPSKTQRVYVACTDSTVKVVNLDGRQLAALSGHQDWVCSVVLSPDEKILASGSADGTVKLWSTDDHRLLATLLQLAPRRDEWLVVTPQGFLATSSPAALAWKAAKLTTPSAQVSAQLQNAESVAKTIAGAKLPPPKLK